MATRRILVGDWSIVRTSVDTEDAILFFRARLLGNICRRAHVWREQDSTDDDVGDQRDDDKQR